jgi:hypothetical protein
MKEPRVVCASCQNSEAASGSPSIGARMMFTGTPAGSWRTAWRNRRWRWLPLTLEPRGASAPCVGSPSVIRKMLSGTGDRVCR